MSHQPHIWEVLDTTSLLPFQRRLRLPRTRPPSSRQDRRHLSIVTCIEAFPTLCVHVASRFPVAISPAPAPPPSKGQKTSKDKYKPKHIPTPGPLAWKLFCLKTPRDTRPHPRCTIKKHKHAVFRVRCQCSFDAYAQPRPCRRTSP